PLPCIGTQVCVSVALTIASSQDRTRAVTALNAASQEPQSRSMALLVASDVVSGPGVRRIGSRSKLLMADLRAALMKGPARKAGRCKRDCSFFSRDAS